MSSTAKVLRRAVISGSAASVSSTLALAGCGTRDCSSAYAPVNAVSHWLWRDKAVAQQRPTLRYTITGYLIHHSMSIFWALAYEALLASPRNRRSRVRPVAAAAGVAAAACVVDLKATPERLTPGFERRLSSPSLALVYASFGLGLLLTHLARRR